MKILLTIFIYLLTAFQSANAGGIPYTFNQKIMGGVSVDIPPFPEWNSGHYIEIPGEGIVFTGEKDDDGKRCYSGVIESHYSTDD